MNYAVHLQNERDDLLKANALLHAMLTSERAANDRLRAALAICGADFATKPGTVMSAHQEIAEEFQRRIQIAADAFADEQSSRPIKCEGCDTGIADPPSRLCPGCQAYVDHQR